MSDSIGQRIRELRKARGWSAQRLSDETNGAIGRVSIADIERGHTRDISLTAGLAIARAFGITVEQLVDTDDVPSTAVGIAAEIVAARERLAQALASERTE